MALHLLHCFVAISSFDDLDVISVEPHLGQVVLELVGLEITTGPVMEQLKTKNFLNIIISSCLITIMLDNYKYLMFFHIYLKIIVKNRTLRALNNINLIIPDD
jgi:hypothetical protein